MFMYYYTMHIFITFTVGDMSIGRQQAFEIFKRDYHENATIEKNKTELRQKYAEAKKLGEQVNKDRGVISMYLTIAFYPHNNYNSIRGFPLTCSP